MRAIQSKSGLYHNVGTNPEKVKIHAQLIDATKTAIQNKLNIPTITTEININQFVDKTQISHFPSIKEVIMTSLNKAYQIGLVSNGKLIGFDLETQSPMSVVFKGDQMILTPNGEGIDDTSALKRFVVSDVFNKLAKQQRIDLSELKSIEQSNQNPTPTSVTTIQPTLKAINPGPVAPLNPTQLTSLPLPLPAATLPLPNPAPPANTTQTNQPQIKPAHPKPAPLQVPAPILLQTPSSPDPITKPTPQDPILKPKVEANPGNYKSNPNQLKKDKLKALNWSKFTDIKVFPDNKVMLVGIDRKGVKSVQVISTSNALLIQDFKTLSSRLLTAQNNCRPELQESSESKDDDNIVDFFIDPETTKSKLEQIPTSSMFDEYLEYTKSNLANPSSLLNTNDLTFGFTQLADEIYYNFYSPSPNSAEANNNLTSIKATYSSNLASAANLATFDSRLTRNNGSWQFATFGNFSKLPKEDTGRIYFNIDPLQAPLLYNRIVERLNTEKLTSQIKIPSKYENRPDCAVLYFDQAQQSEIQKIINDIVSSNDFTFRDELGKGQHPIGKGIGFAQEPSIPIINGAAFAYNSEGQVSFGEKISRIMGVVLSNIKSQNLDQVKDKDKINQMYTTLIKKHGIDPNNPAFYNENSKFESFKTFKV